MTVSDTFGETSLTRWLTSGHKIMARSVAESTASSYQVGWKKWTTFASSMAVSPLPPSVDNGVLVNGILWPCMVALTVAFCAFSFNDAVASPSSICGYLAGVAYHLRLANIDTAFLCSPAVLMAKAGMKRLSVSSDTPSRGYLPFSLDMISAYASFVNRSSNNLNLLGIVTAMKLAFTCLLRRSEYIPTQAEHFIRASNVSFILSDGTSVFSYEFHASLAPNVVQVVVCIPSSKRDQDRKGFTFTFACNHPPSAAICSAIIHWAGAVHLLPTDPFLSARNSSGLRVWCIDAGPLTSAMQATVRSLGFSPAQCKRFTPHSLRYGGASTLAAAGVDRYQIQLAGRWKSDTFMTYVLASHSVFERTNAALADPFLLTSSNIRQAH